MFYDALDWKEGFVEEKYIDLLQLQKLDFSKGFNRWFWPKNHTSCLAQKGDEKFGKFLDRKDVFVDWRNINFIFSLKWDFVSKLLTHDVGDKIEKFFSSFLVLKGYEIMFLMLFIENMPLHNTRWSVLYSRKNGIFAKWLTYLRYLPRVRSGWQDFGHVFFWRFYGPRRGNNMQESEQTDATCYIQQCRVRLHGA